MGLRSLVKDTGGFGISLIPCSLGGTFRTRSEGRSGGLCCEP
jgi:hypothetical protein